MAKEVSQLIMVRPAYQVKRGAVKNESVLGVQYSATATFDTTLKDSSGVANTAIGAHGLGVFLPTKAIVVRALIQVVTGFTSAGGNAGTLALSIQSANDLKTATAVSNAIYSGAGLVDATPAHTAASAIALTAERELVVTVAGQVMTAGKFVVYVEYVIGA